MPTLVMPRRYGAVNWRGLWTLCLKDLHRARKNFRYSVLGPVVSNLLFLAVFAVARGRAGSYVGDLSLPSVPGAGARHLRRLRVRLLRRRPSLSCSTRWRA